MFVRQGHPPRLLGTGVLPENHAVLWGPGSEVTGRLWHPQNVPPGTRPLTGSPVKVKRDSILGPLGRPRALPLITPADSGDLWTRRAGLRLPTRLSGLEPPLRAAGPSGVSK